jgi:hypothetical protein
MSKKINIIYSLFIHTNLEKENIFEKIVECKILQLQCSPIQSKCVNRKDIKE